MKKIQLFSLFLLLSVGVSAELTTPQGTDRPGTFPATVQPRTQDSIVHNQTLPGSSRPITSGKLDRPTSSGQAEALAVAQSFTNPIGVRSEGTESASETTAMPTAAPGTAVTSKTSAAAASGNASAGSSANSKGSYDASYKKATTFKTLATGEAGLGDKEKNQAEKNTVVAKLNEQAANNPMAAMANMGNMGNMGDMLNNMPEELKKRFQGQMGGLFGGAAAGSPKK